MAVLRSLGAVRRVLHATGYGLWGLWLIRSRFSHFTPAERAACIEAWTRRMLSIFNIAVRIEGTAPTGGPLLQVANHTSWVDILAVQAARTSRFVAKSDIRDWPLIGPVTAGVGTLFIERASRRDALRTVHRMAESLQAGDIITVFPEGTTTDGRSLLPFHGNLLQAALATGTPVLPVGIHFIDAATGVTTHVAAYAGDDTLISSLWRTLTADPIVAVVRYGTPAGAGERDRRQWAEDLHAEVDRLRQ